MELTKKDVASNARNQVSHVSEPSQESDLDRKQAENSPRRKMILAKFPGQVENGEKLIDSFHCAL